MASIKVDLKRLFTETIGALGARRGTRSEQSFRNALKGILEEATDYKLLNVIEEDTDGACLWMARASGTGYSPHKRQALNNRN